MTLAPSLAVKILGGITITAVWLVPHYVAQLESPPWQPAHLPTDDTMVVETTKPHRSRTSIAFHTRYFSTGTTLIYSW